MKTLIVEVKRNSLDDGPGIRTVVFFKGCPLGCVWCQNPETKSAAREIAWEAADCSGCGACIEVCEAQALDFSGGYPIDRMRCNLCGACVAACKGGGLAFVGREYPPEELIGLILKDKVFYCNSGGGLTLSGGEPTLHAAYLERILPVLKERGIHVCLETCGYYVRETFEQSILPYVDLIYFDLKLFDPMDHQRFCRFENSVILDNFAALTRQAAVELVPRIPLVPGITATRKNLTALREYLTLLGHGRVELLPYNPLWQSKILKLGKISEYEHKTWMEPSEIQTARRVFQGFELNLVDCAKSQKTGSLHQ